MATTPAAVNSGVPPTAVLPPTASTVAPAIAPATASMASAAAAKKPTSSGVALPAAATAIAAAAGASAGTAPRKSPRDKRRAAEEAKRAAEEAAAFAAANDPSIVNATFTLTITANGHGTGVAPDGRCYDTRFAFRFPNRTEVETTPPRTEWSNPVFETTLRQVCTRDYLYALELSPLLEVWIDERSCAYTEPTEKEIKDARDRRAKKAAAAAGGKADHKADGTAPAGAGGHRPSVIMPPSVVKPKPVSSSTPEKAGGAAAAANATPPSAATSVSGSKPPIRKPATESSGGKKAEKEAAAAAAAAEPAPFVYPAELERLPFVRSAVLPTVTFDCSPLMVDASQPITQTFTIPVPSPAAAPAGALAEYNPLSGAMTPTAVASPPVPFDSTAAATARPPASLVSLTISIRVDKPLLAEALIDELQPCAITIVGAHRLPTVPLPYAQMDIIYRPVYATYTFLDKQTTIGAANAQTTLAAANNSASYAALPPPAPAAAAGTTTVAVSKGKDHNPSLDAPVVPPPSYASLPLTVTTHGVAHRSNAIWNHRRVYLLGRFDKSLLSLTCVTQPFLVWLHDRDVRDEVLRDEKEAVRLSMPDGRTRAEREKERLDAAAKAAEEEAAERKAKEDADPKNRRRKGAAAGGKKPATGVSGSPAPNAANASPATGGKPSTGSSSPVPPELKKDGSSSSIKPAVPAIKISPLLAAGVQPPAAGAAAAGVTATTAPPTGATATAPAATAAAADASKPATKPKSKEPAKPQSKKEAEEEAKRRASAAADQQTAMQRARMAEGHCMYVEPGTAGGATAVAIKRPKPATDHVVGVGVFSLSDLFSGAKSFDLRTKVIPIYPAPPPPAPCLSSVNNASSTLTFPPSRWHARYNPYEAADTELEIEVRLLKRLPGLQPHHVKHKFARAIYIFRYNDTATLQTIINTVADANLRALGMTGAPRRSLVNVRLTPEQRLDTSELDILTGFQVIDNDYRMVVVEGLADVQAIHDARVAAAAAAAAAEKERVEREAAAAAAAAAAEADKKGKKGVRGHSRERVSSPRVPVPGVDEKSAKPISGEAPAPKAGAVPPIAVPTSGSATPSSTPANKPTVTPSTGGKTNETPRKTGGVVAAGALSSPAGPVKGKFRSKKERDAWEKAERERIEKEAAAEAAAKVETEQRTARESLLKAEHEREQKSGVSRNFLEQLTRVHTPPPPERMKSAIQILAERLPSYVAPAPRRPPASFHIRACMMFRPPISSSYRFLQDPSVTFHTRLYTSYDVALKNVKLITPLSSIIADPKVYLPKHMDGECYHALQSLSQLRTAVDRLRAARTAGVFPTVEQLSALEKRYGGFVSDLDLEGPQLPVTPKPIISTTPQPQLAATALNATSGSSSPHAMNRSGLLQRAAAAVVSGTFDVPIIGSRPTTKHVTMISAREDASPFGMTGGGRPPARVVDDSTNFDANSTLFRGTTTSAGDALPLDLDATANGDAENGAITSPAPNALASTGAARRSLSPQTGRRPASRSRSAAGSGSNPPSALRGAAAAALGSSTKPRTGRGGGGGGAQTSVVPRPFGVPEPIELGPPPAASELANQLDTDQLAAALAERIARKKALAATTKQQKAATAPEWGKSRRSTAERLKHPNQIDSSRKAELAMPWIDPTTTTPSNTIAGNAKAKAIVAAAAAAKTKAAAEKSETKTQSPKLGRRKAPKSTPAAVTATSVIPRAAEADEKQPLVASTTGLTLIPIPVATPPPVVVSTAPTTKSALKSSSAQPPAATATAQPPKAQPAKPAPTLTAATGFRI